MGGLSTIQTFCAHRWDKDVPCAHIAPTRLEIVKINPTGMFSRSALMQLETQISINDHWLVGRWVDTRRINRVAIVLQFNGEYSIFNIQPPTRNVFLRQLGTAFLPLLTLVYCIWHFCPVWLINTTGSVATGSALKPCKLPVNLWYFKLVK